MGDVGRDRGVSDEATRPTHPLSDGPLPFRMVMDVGLMSYDEFACSHSTLSWLLSSGIPVDARLQVVEQCRGGHNVIVKAWPT